MDYTDLNSFLKLGYFLNTNNDKFNLISDFQQTDYKTLTESELKIIGKEKYRNAISSQFNSSDTQLLPISGGLDSRGLLGGLLELTEAKNINTFTFGVPGTFDFDIGNYIAKQAGTNHTSYNLNDYAYSLNELIDISRRSNHQTLLFHNQPVWDTQSRFENNKIWSGVSIESWFGSHVKQYHSQTSLESHKQNFILDNVFVNSIDLTNIEDIEYNNLIESNWDDRIPLEIRIDLLNRQSKFILPNVLVNGFDYKVLFYDANLIDFALSLPRKYLINRNFYHKLLFDTFPYLFKLPYKNNYGLPLYANNNKIKLRRAFYKIKSLFPNSLSPFTNYIDFNEGIRNRKDLNTIIYSSVMDLKERKIVDWIDIDNIWKRHINKESDHADALITLASLEIHLKAGKIL